MERSRATQLVELVERDMLSPGTISPGAIIGERVLHLPHPFDEAVVQRIISILPHLGL